MSSPLSRLRAFPPEGGQRQRPAQVRPRRSTHGLLRGLSSVMSFPLSRLRAFPLRGTTPGARRRSGHGVPRMACSAATYPSLV